MFLDGFLATVVTNYVTITRFHFYITVSFTPKFCFCLLQFLKYVEPDEEINPPIKLEPCLAASGDQVYLTEPLVDLLK